MNKRAITVLSAVVATAFAATGCDVKKVEDGHVQVPKYEVTKTQEGDVKLPKVEVTGPDVTVAKKEVEVTVPKVTTEKETVTVPKVEIKTGKEKAAEQGK